MLLLTHGFFLAEDAKEQKVMRPYPPLGILYLSAYLRRKGFEVEVYDSTFGSKQELFSILDRGAPSWLGVYGNLLTRANVLEIVERRLGRDPGESHVHLTSGIYLYPANCVRGQFF